MGWGVTKLSSFCSEELGVDPDSTTAFVFSNRSKEPSDATARLGSCRIGSGRERLDFRLHPKEGLPTSLRDHAAEDARPAVPVLSAPSAARSVDTRILPRQERRAKHAIFKHKNPRNEGFLVPRPALEPPTRGFSILRRVWPTPRKDKGKVAKAQGGQSHVGLRREKCP
jgi:hypothetical protein